MSEVRNVPTRTTHLGRVAAVNQLSRQIASGEVDTIDVAETRLAQARCIPFPKDWVQLAAGMGGAFCFALIFGGDLKAGLAAAAAGVAANAYLLFCGRHGVGAGSEPSPPPPSSPCAVFWAAACWALKPVTPSSAP